MIKRIELVNFMSHAHTVIEPAAGLTVLVGPNNCGKSAVVTALQVLAHNANSTYVMRHGEKTCEVIVETADGHTVKWSRSKSGSPKYEIDGEAYDRLKGATPENLPRVLGLPKVANDRDEFDIHFGQQKEPVFLLNDSGKAAAEFFASSSDAFRLVQMQDRHKLKVRESRRDQKRLQAESDRLNVVIEILSESAEIETELAATEAEYLELQKCQQRQADLELKVQLLGQLKYELFFQQSLAQTYDRLSLPPKLQPTVELENLLSRFKTLLTTELRSSNIATALAQATQPPALQPTLALESLIARLHTLSTVARQSSTVAAVLHTASIPPQMAPTHELEKMIGQLQLLSSTEWQSSRLVATLDLVATPPRLADEIQLDSLLDQLSRATLVNTVLTAREKMLKKIEPPPVTNDLQLLENFIFQLEQAQKNTSQLAQQLQKIVGQIDLLVVESKQWADANPVCPTCGAATDAQRLLKSQQEGGCHE